MRAVGMGADVTLKDLKFLRRHLGADLTAHVETRYGQCSLVHVLARAGRTAELEYVLEHGADLGAKDKNGLTALHIAALGGHAEICRFLLDRGARCEPDTYVGERVFYAALNDELRALLRAYNLSARARDPFAEHVRRACAAAHFTDVVFELELIELV